MPCLNICRETVINLLILQMRKLRQKEVSRILNCEVNLSATVVSMLFSRVIIKWEQGAMFPKNNKTKRDFLE